MVKLSKRERKDRMKTCKDPNCLACSFINQKSRRKPLLSADLSIESLEKLAFKRQLNQKFDELLAIQQVMRLRRQRAERLKIHAPGKE